LLRSRQLVCLLPETGAFLHAPVFLLISAGRPITDIQANQDGSDRPFRRVERGRKSPRSISAVELLTSLARSRRLSSEISSANLQPALANCFDFSGNRGAVSCKFLLNRLWNAAAPEAGIRLPTQQVVLVKAIDTIACAKSSEARDTSLRASGARGNAGRDRSRAPDLLPEITALRQDGALGAHLGRFVRCPSTRQHRKFHRSLLLK
jgi:hypothetical protein